MGESKHELMVATDVALAEIENAIDIAVVNEELAIQDDFEADLDLGDFCMAFFSGLANVAITTNEGVEKWLAAVHDAASGKTGKYDFVQKLLGKAFYHKGDALDVFAPGEGFVGRNGEAAFIAFHRLLFGHDPLAIAIGKDKPFMPVNPFEIMFNQQKGMKGILQAVRHLVADTMSKQGLPLPGSSFLDTEILDDGRTKPWNEIINWVQELSIEAFGNKSEAQAIYSHLFTVRMQDIAGAGLTAALLKAYEKGRGITDPVRIAQLELLGIAIAFFGQAAVGAVKQKGVPYINNVMIPQLAAAYIALLRSSGKRTAMLRAVTYELEGDAEKQIGNHDNLKDTMRIAIPHDEDPRLITSSAEDLIDFLDERVLDDAE